MSQAYMRVVQGSEVQVVSPTSTFRSLPSLEVQRGGVVQIPANSAWVNFIGAMAVKLDLSLRATGSSISFLNSSLSGPVVISLKSGGLINGQSSYSLSQGNASNPPQFSFDGTNLVLQT